MSVKPAGDPPAKPTTDSQAPTPGQIETPPADQKVYSESELEARAEELRRTGTEALQAENEELKRSLQMRDAREEMTAVLTKSGARSPELLFNSAKESLQFDAEGKVANAAALVEQLKRSFPEQFGVAAHASIDGGTGRNSGFGYLTKEKLAMMSAHDIAKLDWQEVKRVLAEG